MIQSIYVKSENPVWIAGIRGRKVKSGVLVRRKIFGELLNIPKTLTTQYRFHILNWDADGADVLVEKFQVGRTGERREAQYLLQIRADGIECSCQSAQYRSFRQDVQSVFGETCKHHACLLAILNPSLERQYRETHSSDSPEKLMEQMGHIVERTPLNEGVLLTCRNCLHNGYVENGRLQGDLHTSICDGIYPDGWDEADPDPADFVPLCVMEDDYNL